MENLNEFKVNAQAIAYLLNARKGQSFQVGQLKSMIARIILGRNPKNDDEVKYYGSQYISIAQFEKAYSHYPILDAVLSIRKDYLNHPSTYNYIMDYPLDRMSASKTPIKKIRVPSGLGEILTGEQKSLIISKWQKRYRGYEVEF